ncbi:MAG: thiol:disulfide interchange protein DsbA/DsbL [Burkholderiales bacterium]
MSLAGRQLLRARRLSAVAMGVLAWLIMSFAWSGEPTEDLDYFRIPAGRAPVTEKIEILEFFYYGCGACNRYEPHAQAWLTFLPADVTYRRIPALRRQEWIPLARVFFALESLNELDRLHAEVYRGIHDHEMNLADSSQLFKWAGQNGLERERLKKALDAETLDEKIQRARDATVLYSIRTTPTIVVDGRYLTSSSMAGSADTLVLVVDALVRKAREDRTRP